MATRIRSFDWASTPVGPIEHWEDTLLITVNLLLASRQPMFLFWGAEHTQFYNDDYRATLDDSQHPDTLGNRGRITWANIWHIIGPQVEAVMRGEALFVEDQFIPGRRVGNYDDTYWSYSYTPVRDPRGIVRGVFVVCSDNTSTVLFRRIVDKEKQRLADLFEQAPAFFAVLRGATHVFEFTNASYQQLIGYREVLGKTLIEGLPEASRQGFGDLLDGVYTTGKPYIGRNDPFSIAGATRYLDFIYQPMREIDGSISGILVFGVDVTEGYRAQQMLIQREKLAVAGQMAATIAHEINNPLEAVTNLLYIARQDAEAGPVRDSLDLADQELRRVAAICSQTLRFHRQLSNPTEAHASHLFTDSLMIYECRLQKIPTSQALAIERRERATHGVLCYEGEVRQVLNNLIGNALDALPNGGRLLLRSAEASDARTGVRGLRLTVADNGAGIAPVTLRRIFEPFFTTKGSMGTGLGLWVSHEIAQRHGGSLRVRSSQQANGHGTIFTLFLPFEPVPRI